jgi:hypothetical protein
MTIASSWCTSGPPSSKNVLAGVIAEQSRIGLAMSITASTMTRGVISPHSLQGLAKMSLWWKYSSR